MQELLYLKDEQIKEIIEKLFIAYRESYSDSKNILNKHKLGIAHHKVILLSSIYKGITISDLLKRLKVTKQSLNRVLKDLLKKDILSFEKGKKDNRLKHVHLTKTGKKIFDELFFVQKKRIYKALLNSSSKEVLFFNNVMKKIINE